jgi:hypothetical protein
MYFWKHYTKRVKTVTKFTNNWIITWDGVPFKPIICTYTSSLKRQKLRVYHHHKSSHQTVQWSISTLYPVPMSDWSSQPVPPCNAKQSMSFLTLLTSILKMEEVCPSETLVYGHKAIFRSVPEVNYPNRHDFLWDLMVSRRWRCRLSWIITPRGPVSRYQDFGGTHSLHLQCCCEDTEETVEGSR